MLTRRQFLKTSAIVGAGMAVPVGWLANPRRAFAYSESPALKKFVQPLRIVGHEIPVATSDAPAPSWVQPGATHYTIDIAQFEDQLHPDLPNKTRLWGFGQGDPKQFRHLSGVVAAKRGEPVQITFRNNLPPDHILPVDRTIMGAGEQDNRTDVHLHGGRVPWTSDGGPFAWWDPDGHVGPSFLNNAVLRQGQSVPANEAEYYYPNDQGSRLLWYHDHSLGVTRLNAYAGIASAFVIYDDYELDLVAGGLPGPLDPRTLYLAVQDKVFVRDDIDMLDPSWSTVMPRSRPGDLWYPHVYEPGRWDLDAVVAPPNPSVIPEFFGDTMLVNGTVYPTLEVEQRQYRFRILNACNARFLNPRLVFARGSTFPDDTEPSAVAGPAFVQIGTEGGFLPAPAMLNGPGQVRLLLAPAERADLIVDFRDVPAGSTLILANDAAAPYPMGDDRDDFYRSRSSRNAPGFGPDTRTLLQIRVKARVGLPDAPVSLPPRLTPTDPFFIDQVPGVPTPVPAGVPVRRLTLNEAFDELGRLIQFLGTDEAANTGEEGGPGFGRAYMDKPTEVIERGSTEVWEIANLTGDTHPIHIHLVNAQVLSRHRFRVTEYGGGAPRLQGKPMAPDDNELGWKETVRMNPGEVTRLLMTFDVAAVPFTEPISPRLLADYGISGAEFVWHCHILEHEEHDMMRPLVVV